MIKMVVLIKKIENVKCPYCKKEDMVYGVASPSGGYYKCRRCNEEFDLDEEDD